MHLGHLHMDFPLENEVIVQLISTVNRIFNNGNVLEHRDDVTACFQ